MLVHIMPEKERTATRYGKNSFPLCTPQERIHAAVRKSEHNSPKATP